MSFSDLAKIPVVSSPPTLLQPPSPPQLNQSSTNSRSLPRPLAKPNLPLPTKQTNPQTPRSLPLRSTVTLQHAEYFTLAYASLVRVSTSGCRRSCFTPLAYASLVRVSTSGRRRSCFTLCGAFCTASPAVFAPSPAPSRLTVVVLFFCQLASPSLCHLSSSAHSIPLHCQSSQLCSSSLCSPIHCRPPPCSCSSSSHCHH